eukprot:CAMPEP_0119530432 /NCGR_PEP_ID=MMETSP1344-20130328/44285_1 /TAXON_ID=236787 /ORGANISM="Florenciella parvula, Strain CCMP2471" /LENGTH=36 /DNA_ID= /DNA_START= /DNA_END= /DNA_ORIENTATION=
MALEALRRLWPPHAPFSQAQEDAPTRIDGTIEGLTP